MNTTTVIYALKTLILPPGIQILLIIFAVILWLFGQRFLAFLIKATAWGSLFLFSIPFFSVPFIQSLETHKALDISSVSNMNAEAIVVLGGGRYADAPEYKEDVVNSHDLLRLKYAVKLHNTTNLPILVSGGKVFNEDTSEAELLQKSLTEDFKVETKWLESESKNTKENAELTVKILSENNIKRAFLVTSASHMNRALIEFNRYAKDIDLIPAPTGFNVAQKNKPSFYKFLPSLSSLRQSHTALYEYIGRLWYYLMTLS